MSPNADVKVSAAVLSKLLVTTTHVSILFLLLYSASEPVVSSVLSNFGLET